MREGPKALADLPDLVHPVSQHLFMGVVSRDQLPLVSRLMGGTGDFCDWPQIEAWADDIAATFAEMDARSAKRWCRGRHSPATTCCQRQGRMAFAAFVHCRWS